VARELTKVHEEIFRGTISAARAHFGQKDILGEVTVVVGGAKADTSVTWTAEAVRAEVTRLMAQGLRSKDAARQVAERSGWLPREVYRLATQAGQETQES
jgi:16S rRNA (cytidine1402-2'-O)-methyltransferase